jgi:hypothetical protein
MVRAMSTSHAAGPLHGHDDFDPEPTNELSPGEPRTPLWLSGLGAALFLLAAVYFLLPDKDAAPAVGAAAAEVVEVAAAPKEPAAMRPTAPPPVDAPTREDGANAAKKLSPEQLAELRKRVEQMRQRGLVPQP